MKRWMLLVAAVCLVWSSASYADLVIGLHTQESGATTRPDDMGFSVSVSAVVGHDFSMKFETVGRKIEISGNVESRPDNHYLVKIHYLEMGAMGMWTNSADTSVEMKSGDSIDVCGIQSGAAKRTVVMSLNAS